MTYPPPETQHQRLLGLVEAQRPDGGAGRRRKPPSPGWPPPFTPPLPAPPPRAGLEGVHAPPPRRRLPTKRPAHRGLTSLRAAKTSLHGPGDRSFGGHVGRLDYSVLTLRKEELDPPPKMARSRALRRAPRADLPRASGAPFWHRARASFCRPSPRSTPTCRTRRRLYANRVVLEARGESARITRGVKAAVSAPSSRPAVRASRFPQRAHRVRKAPDVTSPAPLSLKPWNAIFAGMDKVSPRYAGQRHRGRRRALSAAQRPRSPPGRPSPRREPRNEQASSVSFRRRRRPCARHRAVLALFVYQTQQALVLRFGEPIRVIENARPLNAKIPAGRQRDPHRQAHPRPREPSQEVIAADQKSFIRRCLLPVIASPTCCASTVPSARWKCWNSRLRPPSLNSSLRRVLGESTSSRWCATSARR